MEILFFKRFHRVNQVLVVKSNGYNQQTYRIRAYYGWRTIDLGVIVLEEDITAELQLSLVDHY